MSGGPRQHIELFAYHVTLMPGPIATLVICVRGVVGIGR